MLTYNANLQSKFALQSPLFPLFSKGGRLTLLLAKVLIRGILTRPFSNPPSPLFSKRGDYKLTYNANRYLNSPF